MASRVVKKAVVVDVEKRRKPTKHYVYVINVTWTDNSVVVIFRRYSKLFELQTKLFEDFPDEGGVKDPSKRSLPFLPGKIIFGRSNIRDVAEKRKEPINEYCQNLIKLPAKISACDLVLDFFEASDEDISAVEADKQEDQKKDDNKAQNISEPIQLEQYLVISDYQKQNQSEISLLAGDIVEIIEKNDNGWWFVNMDEEQGWVPASYLEPEDGTVENVVTTTYKPGEERYIASTAYTANEPDEIGFQKGVVVDVLQKNVDGWWLIRYNNKDGWAPAIYLKKLDPNQAIPKPHGYENVNLENEHVIPNKPRRACNDDGGGSRSNKPPPRKSSVRRSHKLKNRVRTPPTKDDRNQSSLNEAEYVAFSEIRAQALSGQLSVAQGTSVQILEKSPNGWWFCKIGEEEGWVPSTHLHRQEKRALPENNKLIKHREPKLRHNATPSEEYVAISDYSDGESLNITLKKGAMVKVLDKSDSGWWYVQSCGAEGWAPSTYLEKKTKTEKPKPVPKSRGAASPARPSPPARPTNQPVASGQRAGVKPPGPPIPSRHKKPTLPRNRPEGKSSGSVENLNQNMRLKPDLPLKQARSAENLKSSDRAGVHAGGLPLPRQTPRGTNDGPSRTAGEKPRVANRPARPTQYYVALANFKDNDDDTLDLKQGDRLEVLQRDEGGWWFAKLGEKTGWVPSNYLEK